LSESSNNHAEIRRIFDEHIPEIAAGIIQIKEIARETGRRVIVVVHSSDDCPDPIGYCVGLRGSRIKAMMRLLLGERIDVVRWSESLQDYIRNLLAPAKVEQLTFDATAHRATVAVSGDTTTLTSDGGIRLILASRLAGWDLHLIES
jgi:N utilization substance protein A